MRVGHHDERRHRCDHAQPQPLPGNVANLGLLAAAEELRCDGSDGTEHPGQQDHHRADDTAGQCDAGKVHGRVAPRHDRVHHVHGHHEQLRQHDRRTERGQAFEFGAMRPYGRYALYGSGHHEFFDRLGGWRCGLSAGT